MSQDLADLESRVVALEQRFEMPALPRFYAVPWGRVPAVYATSQEANAQTLGFTNALQRMC